MALLHADGFEGVLIHESLIGTVFAARAGRAGDDGTVVPEIEGMAYRTGEHRFTLDPRDPLGTGFTLR
jgi:proline racemase/trans-L-3-hydroxyproline dehydratase